MLPTRLNSTVSVQPDPAPGPRAARPNTRRLGVPRTRVLKFGGSSVATAERIRDVARIVLNSTNGVPAVVVVSAFQGVTNDLLKCARLAEQRDPAHEQVYEAIADRHRQAIADLVGLPEGRTFPDIDEQLNELRDALHGIRLLGHCPPGALDVVASFGERLSALIVAAYLNRFRGTRFVDARQFVMTDEQFTRANVIFEKTNRATRQFFSSLL